MIVFGDFIDTLGVNVNDPKSKNRKTRLVEPSILDFLTVIRYEGEWQIGMYQ